MVPGYVIAQLAGAFVGASIVYLLFKGQFDATEDPGTKLGVFCTGPSIPNTGLNILSEAVGTFILAFAIKGIGNVTGLSIQVLINSSYSGIIVSVGMSLGGLTGYAINPARDLGPRFAHAVLPIKGKRRFQLLLRSRSSDRWTDHRCDRGGSPLWSDPW